MTKLLDMKPWPLLLLLLPACTGRTAAPREHCTLSIDPAFTMEEMLAIRAGAAAWSIATDGAYTCDCIVTTEPGTITATRQCPQPGMDAWTEWSDDHLHARQLYCPGLVGAYGTAVATHELGHAAGLVHDETDEPSIMHAWSGEHDRISRTDVQHLKEAGLVDTAP